MGEGEGGLFAQGMLSMCLLLAIDRRGQEVLL